MSIIFIFIDGVGLAPAGPDNPLTTAATPALAALLGGPLTLEQVHAGPFLIHGDHGAHRETGAWRTTSTVRYAHPSMSAVDRPLVLLHAIDATLGVPGLPQSGTGQTALLAGVNAAALHGRHQPHFPPTALRPLLASRSIFRRVAARGGSPAFANAFGPGYWEALAARRIRRSASVIAAAGAGVRFRDGDDLRAGEAVAWDITGEAGRARGLDAPPISPQQAGAALARLARAHDLVFFETFLPDLAGHGRWTNDERRTTTDRQPPTVDGQQAAGETADGDERSSLVIGPSSVAAQIHAAMSRIDGLVAGVLAAMRPEDTLLLTSDHGNVESLTAPAHTRNPVPLLAVGPRAAAFAAVQDIAGVADVVVAPDP
ncbi:MAG TPA: metalloenzyme [Roseiflexaceae bacterium]|nr:metalloenzyme [Roseiflexaceae bacterium]